MGATQELMQNFWNDEEGIGTVEILLILAVLIALALIFKNEITAMVNKIFDANGKKVDDLIK
ncbi:MULTISPECIES: Flp1 family type IVb pilin [Bacillaceae]|uniref:Flp1 family type IVb pilin n=1 Tax=Bacillaceae TaxID=186817 RepID=UPI000834861E|nr:MULTISPECIES: Flp1 family type IVb pilin [Bacillaceae]MCM3768620.1 multidrug transporter [Neobacillus niacini]